MVRCPSCAADQSEWAARCGRCGADLTGAPPIPLSGTANPRPLLLLGAGLLLVALVALAVTYRLGHHAGSTAVPGPPATAQPIALHIPVHVLAVDPNGTLLDHNLSTGATTRLAENVAAWPEQPVSVGGHTIYISGGQSYAPGAVVPIAPADSLVAVSGTTDVWATPVTSRTGEVAQRLDGAANWSVAASLSLPAQVTPVAADSTHLVTFSDRGLEVRDNTTGAVLFNAGHISDPDAVIGIDGDRLIFVGPAGCPSVCEIEELSLTDHSEQEIAPLESLGFIGGGAVSPHAVIAAFKAAGDPTAPSGELVLIEPDGSEKTAPQTFAFSEPVGAAAWDPTGRWVIWGGSTETFVLDTTTMAVTPLPFAAGYGFTVLGAG